MAKTISIDYENNAERFYDEIRDRADAPEELRRLALPGGPDEITVSDERAEQIIAYCLSVPGFADGQPHARTALTFRDHDETKAN